MTIQEAIDNIDKLKPNSFEMSDKVRWLSRLDTTIFRDIISTHEKTPAEKKAEEEAAAAEEEDSETAETEEETDDTDPPEEKEFPGYTVDTDPATELLAPAPYDEIYTLYLGSMMDYNNQEYVKFNNSNAMYLSAYQELSNYWNRTHMPKGAKNIYF